MSKRRCKKALKIGVVGLGVLTSIAGVCKLIRLKKKEKSKVYYVEPLKRYRIPIEYTRSENIYIDAESLEYAVRDFDKIKERYLLKDGTSIENYKIVGSNLIKDKKILAKYLERNFEVDGYNVYSD